MFTVHYCVFFGLVSCFFFFIHLCIKVYLIFRIWDKSLSTYHRNKRKQTYFSICSMKCFSSGSSHHLTVSYEELYAFSYNPKQNDQQREEGWQLIDLAAEYERMGVPCDQWQLTDVNRDYKVDRRSFPSWIRSRPESQNNTSFQLILRFFQNITCVNIFTYIYILSTIYKIMVLRKAHHGKAFVEDFVKWLMNDCVKVLGTPCPTF